MRKLRKNPACVCGYDGHALIDKVWRADFLMEAWAQVRRNGGSAGVDGETVKSVESYGVDRWLGELARDLKDGTYAPKPVRQGRDLQTKTGAAGSDPEETAG